MTIGVANTTRCAVFFIEDGMVCRQMLYAEFESVLSQVVAVEELANRQMRAVYVDIDPSLKVSAAVFFLIDFDHSGLVDVRWSLSLPSLVESAVAGPDLGAGPVLQVSRDHCPAGVEADQLWEPSVSEGVNDYTSICQSVSKNRLALSVTEFVDLQLDVGAAWLPGDDGIPILSTKADAFGHKRTHTARTLKDMRQKLSSLKSEQDELFERADNKYRVDLELARRDSEELKWRLAEERRVNEHLKQSLSNQTEAFQRMRGLISSQIGKIEHGEQLGEQLLDEFNRKLNAVTSELHGEMARKEAQLHQRDEQIVQLSEAVEQFEQQNADLQDRVEGGEFLRRMSSAGISHIAAQPGAGEFRVSAKDMEAYLASPQEYAARYCCVEIGHYKAWLAHHQRPVCRHLDGDGRRCELPVHRVESPATFVVNESDCCSQHRSSSLALSRVMKQY
jgi:hypothetical protein